jgi:hypothetical protein
MHAAQASVDACMYNCDVSPNTELVVVRPIARSDIGNLMASFERWNVLPPCDVESTTIEAVKTDLIL